MEAWNAHNEDDDDVDEHGETSDATGTEPTRKRKRRAALACIRCQKRKQKCVATESQKCRSCELKGVDCVFHVKPAKAEYPTSYVMRLEGRVAELEAAIAKYNPNDPLINDHLHTGGQQSSFSSIPAHFQNQTSLGSSDSVSSASPNQAPEQQNSHVQMDRQPRNGVTLLQSSSDLSNTTQMVQGRQPHQQPGDRAAREKIKDEIAAGVALLSLNSSAEAHYLGGSSGFSWAKVIIGMLDQPQTSSSTNTSGERFLARPILVTRRRPASPNAEPLIPSAEVVTALVDAFYLHIQARYPFMDYVLLKKWLSRRNEIIPASNSPTATKDDKTAAFFIWMLLAVGSRLLQNSNLPGVSSPETYYIAALKHLETITSLHNTINIQAFLIMIMYSFRSTEGPSVWHLIGLSLRMCIDLGLHRRNASNQRQNPYAEEIKRRVWWTTFGLDRMMAIALGRPLGIQERDIDQPLPRNIPCDSMDVPVDDDEDGAELSPGHFEYANEAHEFTSMSSAIHIIRLRLIESNIQRAVYRVDKPTRTREEVIVEVDKALKELERWVKASPQRPIGNQYARLPCCSPDWWLHKYEEGRQLLLRPITARSKAGDPYLNVLAQSAASLCQVQLRLHQTPPIAHSLTSLHSIFLSGLTLLHAMQMDPLVIPLRDSSRAIRACSNALYGYSTQFLAAEPFRDAFEDLATASAERNFSKKEPPSLPLPSPVIVNPGTIAQPGDWVGEMTSWMQNADSQNNFLSLLSSMGYVPDVRLAAPQQAALTIPAPPIIQDGQRYISYPTATASSSNMNNNPQQYQQGDGSGNRGIVTSGEILNMAGTQPWFGDTQTSVWQQADASQQEWNTTMANQGFDQFSEYML